MADAAQTTAILRLTREVDALKTKVAHAEQLINEQRSRLALAAKLPKKGEPGKRGDDGDPGPRGPKGDKPDHRWQGTKLAFEKPDGQWGQAVDLRGASGGSSVGISGGGGLSDAPSDGNEYVRKNGAWVVATGGGSLTADDISADIAADETLTTVDEALEKVVGDIELPDLTLLLDNALV